MPSNYSSGFYGPRSPGKQLKDLLERAGIANSDRRLIVDYIADKRLSHNVSERRSLKITHTLVSFRKYLPVDFIDCTYADYQTGILGLYDIGSYTTNKPFKKNTLSDFVTITKGFFTWMVDNNLGRLTIADLRKVRAPKQKEDCLKPGDILTPEEILAFIDNCQSERDRALFSFLYEGGFRVGEVAQMTWGDLEFDSYGIKTTVIFKTGKPRTVRLLSCVPYVSSWKALYPFPITNNSPVFLSRYKTPIKYGQVIDQMKTIAIRAGITKRIYPHLFRHSRITHLLADGIHESVIKLMMWGDIQTDQLRTYAHLSSTNIDTALFTAYNIPMQTPDKNRSISPVICPHCSKINPPGASYCCVCGQGLNDDAMTEADTFALYIKQNPQLLINYLKKIENTQPV